MPSEGGRSHGSLIAFTLGLQYACGLLALTVASDLFGDPIDVTVRRLVFVLGAAACAIALFHLGRPLRVGRVLSNVRRSPLSREVLITAAFIVAVAVHTTMANGVSPWLRVAWGLVTLALGLGAAVAGAAVYTIPGRPVWNSWWVPASFLGTVLLAAGSGVAIAGRDSAPPGLITSLLLATATGSVLHVASVLRMVTVATTAARYQAAIGGEFETGVHERRKEKLSVALSVALGGIVPLAIALLIWHAGAGEQLELPIVTAAVAAPCAGVALQRWLMFSLGTSIPRF